MAENNSAHKGSIRTYLAQHGGSVEDAGGRGLTDEMARAIGVDKPAALSAVLGQMEADGVITREMRGLRTYRIALVDDDAPPPDAAPAGAGAVRVASRAGNMVGRYESGPAESAVAAAPEPAAGTAVRLRDALARKPKGAAASPAPVAAAVAVDSGASDAPTDTAPRRAVSLREAISQRADAPAPAAPEAPAAPPPPAPSARSGDRAPGRAVSLRDAIAGNTGSAAASGPDTSEASPWDRPSPAGDTGSFRETARLTSLPPVAPAWEQTEGKKKQKKERGAKGPRRRPRFAVPVPSVKSAPSTPIVTAVGIAVAGLVLVTVITIVVSRGSTHHVPATGTPDSSADACRVVSPADATTAFGDAAGDPHFVLGSCVYDDGTHELIVDVARQNGRVLFDSSRSSSAKAIPGIGDDAYYADGRLRVLKGSTLMLITLSPFNADTPNPKLLALAASVSSRL
jgi:hypothetical protein